ALKASEPLLSQDSWSHPHGTNLRDLRQRAAIWKQDQSRPQRQPPPLEREPASGARPRERRQQAGPRLHGLPEGPQSRQGVLVKLGWQGVPGENGENEGLPVGRPSNVTSIDFSCTGAYDSSRLLFKRPRCRMPSAEMSAG